MSIDTCDAAAYWKPADDVDIESANEVTAERRPRRRPVYDSDGGSNHSTLSACSSEVYGRSVVGRKRRTRAGEATSSRNGSALKRRSRKNMRERERRAAVNDNFDALTNELGVKRKHRTDRVSVLEAALQALQYARRQLGINSWASVLEQSKAKSEQTRARRAPLRVSQSANQPSIQIESAPALSPPMDAPPATNLDQPKWPIRVCTGREEQPQWSSALHSDSITLPGSPSMRGYLSPMQPWTAAEPDAARLAASLTHAAVSGAVDSPILPATSLSGEQAALSFGNVFSPPSNGALDMSSPPVEALVERDHWGPKINKSGADPP